MKLPHLKPRIRSIDLSTVASQQRLGPLRMGGRALQTRNARIALRDMYTCQACRRVTDKCEGEVDHRTPLALGGNDEPANLQWLCIECHRAKSKQENAQRCM
jgi:5-methylcytosine-specific restriction protein A